jgi:glycosyltransferase involved in cell wall biosynthesis
MSRRIKVLSVGTAILGNAVYHANLCASLEKSTQVQIIGRSVADYWDLRAKLMFATVGSSRWGAASYRYRAEWVMSEVARSGLRKDIERVKPDVIHCHTQAHALRCHRIARHVPLVVTMDATSRLLQRLPSHFSQRGALERISRMEDRIFQTCAVLGGVSKWVTRSLEKDYALPVERAMLCSPCVDTDFFAPASSTGNTARSKDKLRIVFVGNDLERKGGRLLLELMAEGLAGIAELHMVSGSEAPDSLPSGVTWHRGLKPCTLPLLEQMQLADVFALPTYEDCFPQVLIEAMACGLPLVSTNVMGVPELAQDGVNGFCLEPGDKHSLAKALQALAQSPELRGRFSTASRNIACRHFSFTASRQAWENIFTQAAMTPEPFRDN